jgi:6,7-dimethyl-8-ribityllumazine synthase
MSRQTPVAAAIEGAPYTVAIAAARFNQPLVNALLAHAEAELRAAGVRPERLIVVRVPGSHELPSAIQWLCAQHHPDATIALGVVIRGATRHYELVSDAVGRGLMDVALATQVAVINGVIVAETRAQAVARCSGPLRRGGEFARAALEMAELRRRLSR